MAGFIEFNQGYRTILEEWDLLLDGINPVARTNVAPAVAPPAELSSCGTKAAPPVLPATGSTPDAASTASISDGVSGAPYFSSAILICMGIYVALAGYAHLR